MIHCWLQFTEARLEKLAMVGTHVRSEVVERPEIVRVPSSGIEVR